MSCNSKISASVALSCTDYPAKGIEGSKAVLVNYEDIDWTASTVDGSGKLTALVLSGLNTGYSIEWYKELGSASSAFSPNAEDMDGFSHTFTARLPNQSAANADVANELRGGRFMVVVQTKYKGDRVVGTNLEAFKAYGFESGMILTEMTNSTNENSGSLLFTLATPDGSIESHPYLIYSTGVYATDLASFNANFA